MPLTGNLVQTARYPTVALSAPLSGDHTAGAVPDAKDIFGGDAPAEPGPDYGTPGVWVAPEETTPHTPWRPDRLTHQAATAPRLTPERLGWVEAQYVARDQMMIAHGYSDASTALKEPQQPEVESAGAGNIVNRQQGLTSWESGLSGPLARGRNSYAQNNPGTVVYDGAGLRLGYDVLTWGEYHSPTKQAMEYQLRAVPRQTVTFPVDTPPVQDPMPFTSPFSGTQTALSPYGGRPRLFTPPNTSGMSDVAMATAPAPTSTFASDGEGWG